MRALVTGGSGFIGSHVVDRLIADGHEVRVFDQLPWPYDRSERCETFVGDLLDPGALRAAAQDCDAIIHCAAAADVGLVAKDPAGAETLNARGTLNVLEAARETGAHVVYASTIWVYSDVVEPEVDEDSQLALPSHIYTATKLAGEMYCRSYHQLYGVSTTILRFGIPYGPRARPAAVLPIFVNKALAGEALTIAGDGLQTRRFVYVEDLAEGVVSALRPEAYGRVYNLVGNEDTSVVEIAEAVKAVFGEVRITHTEGRNGDFAGARVCGERAARELGWRARTSFTEGVERYVAWHCEQAPAAQLPAPAPAVSALVAQPSAAAAAATRKRPHAPQWLTRSVVAALSGFLALVVYAYVLHVAGLESDDEHTVLVVAVLGLASTVSIGSAKSRIAVWALAALGALLLIPAQTSGPLDLARLDLPLLMLGLAGAGFAMLAVMDGRRRALEPSLAAEQGET